MRLYADDDGGDFGVGGEICDEGWHHHAEGGFVVGLGVFGDEGLEFGDCGAEAGGVLGCGVDWHVELVGWGK